MFSLLYTFVFSVPVFENEITTNGNHSTTSEIATSNPNDNLDKGLACPKCTSLWTKGTTLIKGGFSFNWEVTMGILSGQTKEQYIPAAFAQFMDSLWMNPKLTIPMGRELGKEFSDNAKVMMGLYYKIEVTRLGEPFKSDKRGKDFPILNEEFFYPHGLNLSYQKEFIQRCYPQHIPKENQYHEVNGIYHPRMQIYRLRRKDTGKYLIYYPGGAFLMNHYTIFSQLPTKYKDYNLVFVQYALAPEYAYPQGLVDAVDAYHIINSKFLPKSIVLMGDSAGGHLSLQVALYSKTKFNSALEKRVTEFNKQPSCIVLLSPWTDMTLSGPSVEQNRNLDVIKPKYGFHKFRELYLGLPLKSNPIPCEHAGYKTTHFVTDKELALKQFSPVNNDLSNLPPILVHTGDHEVLKSDNENLVQLLRTVGNKCEHHIFPDQVHMFQSLSILKTARQSFREIREFIDKWNK